MPFTLAHPAAILGLRRPLGKYGILSALVIGSFAPDLGYCLPLHLGRLHTHSLGGLFWFCLPAGLLGYLLYHLLLKHPLLGLLSPGLRTAIEPIPSRLPKAIAIGISLLVGILTHLAWDSFTHIDGLAVRNLPWLQGSIASIGWYQFHVFKLLQHASSLLGLAVTAWVVKNWIVRQPTAARNPLLAPHALPWIGAWLMIPPGIGLLFSLHFLSWQVHPATYQTLVGKTVFTTLPIQSAWLLLYGILWQLRNRASLPK